MVIMRLVAFMVLYASVALAYRGSDWDEDGEWGDEYSKRQFGSGRDSRMNRRHFPETPSPLDMEKLERHLFNILQAGNNVYSLINESASPFPGNVTKDSPSNQGQILKADPISILSGKRMQNASVDSSPIPVGKLVAEKDSSIGVISSLGNNLQEDYKSEVHPCHQKVDVGLCKGYFLKWYYNVTDGTCNSFGYGGCKGNRNNFDNEYKCYAACTGEIPCPSNPHKVCRVSESVCANATCPSNPDAECVVLPCSCQAVFKDYTGKVVDCEIIAGNSVKPGLVNIDLINPSSETKVKDGRLAPSKVSLGNELDISELDVSRTDVSDPDVKDDRLAPSMVFPGGEIHVQPEQETGIFPSLVNGTVTSNSTPVLVREEDLSIKTTKGEVTDTAVTKGGQPNVNKSSIVPVSPTESVEVMKSDVLDINITVTTVPPANTTDTPHELIGSTVAIICLASLGATVLVLLFVLCYYRWKRMKEFDPIITRPGMKHDSSDVETLNSSPSSSHGEV